MEERSRGHREYGFLGSRGELDRTFAIRKGQVISGYTVGIMLLDVWYPIIPGNVVNAWTYDFPVRLKAVPGADQKRMHSGDPALLDDLVATGRELEMEGCRVVCGACGYFGHFQSQVREALNVPVYLSSLVQIPWIKAGIRREQKIGLICADKPSLTPDLWESCGVEPKDCRIEEIPRGGEFSAILHSDKGYFDNRKVREEVVATARQLVADHDDIGAILLECSDMPPYAADVQRAVNLPVFDFVTMIRYANSAVAQRPYYGFV
ncbi:MAG: aspartate/glutamate racemase family protein [Synergistales bacterium]|nr:aspartate/glutamate racemase family protein [Synergistales bacterium]